MNDAELQRRLEALGLYSGAIDGIRGPMTWAGLFRFAGCKDTARAKELGAGAHKHLPAYDITTALRIAHFMAQAAHETGGFRWLEEIWGPTAAQRRYEGRADLGNVHPGDGERFKGRGIFQLTGRANYMLYGARLRLPLEENPVLAADPVISILIACQYWKDKGLNALADADNIEAITRRINGGMNGFADRVAKLSRLQGILQ